MKKLSPPALYRLTLARPAFNLFAARVKRVHVAYERPDGKIDVGISYNTWDQIKTAAKPNENLSDTVVRIMSPKQPVQ
jgi:hypothetical protein